ncbi:hypothetical protein CBR_g4616 [Chara braunii]|uniref:DUF659 domain-containing protein n=1 Tax=Chara braunii TaxID=69332 RepID=A0A388KIA8_CHABU|nr:hypothetical protein CBR_g4616 [Chara braunii]|eukprot:GBG69785.1 hypothetical protein CBR_g4616 [Chara braunii]
MMAPRKGRGEQQFVPVSKDKQREAELKFCGFKWITKGQILPDSNGNFLMECKLCGRGFQGSESKAAQHFTIKNNCAQVTAEQLAEIWNKTNYPFDQSHHRKIIDFLRSRLGREARGGARQGKDEGEKAVAEDSTPDEHDDDNDDDDDQDADLGASLDVGLMAAGRRGQEGAAKAMKDTVQSKTRKRKATTPAPPLPKKGKVLQQTSMTETFDPAWQRDFTNEFLQWWYVNGIPFEATRRPEYQRVRKRLLECPPYTHPELPTHRLIFGDGITQQQRVVAEMVAAVRKDIAATGATILMDGRKSITSDQIVNFLVAGPTGAYLFRTVQRNSAVQETAEVVVERWKDVFDNFGVENVNAICTDSVSVYVAASKLLAKEEVKGGRVMIRMWSWALAMVDRVARARLNRTSREELNIVVQACQGTRDVVDERDDEDDDDREGYEGSSEDEDDPAYSPRCGRGDDADADDEGGDGTQAAGGLRRSGRHRADRCSGAGRGDSGAGMGVGGAEHTGGACRGGGGRARRESASSTRTVHWVDEGAATGEVGTGSAEFAAALAVAAAEAAGEAVGEFAAASEEVAGGFAEVVGGAAQVGRASAQLGVSFSGILDVSLGPPPTPAGERGSGDAAATLVGQILRDVPSCSMGDISSSMLQEAAAGTQCSSGQEECAAGDGGDCRPEQERAPDIESRARAKRMRETGGSEGHHATDDAVLECGGAGAGDAGERPASTVQGVCILPIGGAMTAEELERQLQEDPLQADRHGRMDEASRRFMAERPAYVPCSPSLPSPTTGATTSVHAQVPVTGRTTSPTPAEFPPKSRKKKMRVGKSLSTVRRVTHAMRETQPGLAGLHSRTREALALDIVTETVGWRERGSSRSTEQPITAPAEAEMPCTGGGQQAGVVLESGTDDLEMPRGQRRRASVYDLLRAQHRVDTAPQGGVHAPDTTHGPVGGTGGGDGVRGAMPQRRRKDIVDDDDV